MFLDIYSEYDLKHEQVISTITDNGSNFVKAFAEFGIAQSIFIVFLFLLNFVNSKNNKYKIGLGKFINYNRISFNFIYNLF